MVIVLVCFILKEKKKMKKIVQSLYDEINETHLKLIKLVQSRQFEIDYFNEISALEEKQSILNKQLKQHGWFFDFERHILVGLNE